MRRSDREQVAELKKEVKDLCYATITQSSGGEKQMSIKRVKRLTVFKDMDVDGVDVYTVYEVMNSTEWTPGDFMMPSQVEKLIEGDPSWNVIIIHKSKTAIYLPLPKESV